MERADNSWVRRAMFSQTVYRRYDPVKISTSPIAGSSSSEFHSHQRTDCESKSVSLEASHKLSITDGESYRREMRSKPRGRPLSPLPRSCPVPEPSEEAKSEMKKFSTPHPRRKNHGKGAIARIFSRDVQGNRHPNLRLPSRPSPIQNPGSAKTSWAGCFDQRGGRVAAAESMEECRCDLSKLYIGLKFASGGHSKLYHGLYEDQPVAVKVITLPEDDEDGSMVTRLEKEFTREVYLLSHLYHRNVIKLVAGCRTASAFCIVTEYLSGGTLRAFLHKLEHRSLPLPKLVAIGLDIARGMEYIHSQGLVHRDLKPENVIFDEDSIAKIADFGIACEEASCDTFAGDSGTYRWMAPEMIKHKPYCRKVDVYSFGLLLWEMLTGRIPHEDMMPIQAAFAVVDKNLRPTIPADTPPALQALIEECWSLVPGKRPEFSEIAKVLERFQHALVHGGKLDLAIKSTCHHRSKLLINRIQKFKPLNFGSAVSARLL